MCMYVFLWYRRACYMVLYICTCARVCVFMYKNAKVVWNPRSDSPLFIKSFSVGPNYTSISQFVTDWKWLDQETQADSGIFAYFAELFFFYQSCEGRERDEQGDLTISTFLHNFKILEAVVMLRFSQVLADGHPNMHRNRYAHVCIQAYIHTRYVCIRYTLSPI